jgi:hypothetical protein
VSCNSLSARVDFPWSMWAIMQKFLMFFIRQMPFEMRCKTTKKQRAEWNYLANI